MTTKAAEMARVSARGGFNLLWGLVLSTFISALGTIAITYILGADKFGLYSIALIGPSLIATFRDWGVNSAIVKYSAQYNVENKTKIRSIFISGLLFEIILGVSLSLVSFGLSPFLASSLHRPTLVPLIEIASITILAGALINTATAAFTGLEIMHLYSFMLIIQSIAKTALIIGLVLLGFGTFGALTGLVTASVIAGLAGMLLLWTMYKSLPRSINSKSEIFATIKTMLTYGFPVSIGAIISGFMTIFYSYILAFYVSNNATIGNYNLAVNFVVLITFFATPVTTMLFPAFSKLDYKKDNETLKNVFQYSVKYASLIVVPITVLVISLAQPGIGTIYQNRYSDAPLFLALLSVTYLYTAFGSLSATNLINGQGYTAYNMWLSILTVAIGFPVGFLLISQFGVIGLIVSSLTVGLPSLLLSLRFIKNRFGVSVEWVSSAKILFSSAISGALTYLLISQLAFSNPLRLIIGIIAFVFIFITATLLTRTISQSDLMSLRQIVNVLGPLRRPLLFLLNMIEKLMTLLNTK
jgi:O-antigen/teichoic acid export membrane protein